MNNAARLGDNHTCPRPAHIGGDILPACKDTVLIGGQRAARVDDSLRCEIESPDKVKLGEPTVLIGGKPAARKGDPTEHGGIVAQGHATVIIGKSQGEQKRLRLEERLALIDAARDRAENLPDGDTRDRILSAANRLERNNVAVERARLSQSVASPYGAPPGYQRLTGDMIPRELRSQGVYNPETGTFSDPSSGFHAAIYRSDIDGTYILAYQGTEVTSWRDWVRGNGQNLGWDAPQYRQAVGLAQAANEIYGDDLAITGTSLGGGLASVGSLATGRPAHTFNAAGVHGNTFDRFDLDPSDANDLIERYNVDGEILTGLQESVPGVPDAIGREYGLPAVDEHGNPMGFRPEPNGGNRFTRWVRDRWDDLRGLIDKPQDAIDRHDIKVVINGIEAQKNADIATLEDAT